MKQKPLFSAKVISKALGSASRVIPSEHLAIIEDWQKKTEFGGKETNLDGPFLSEFVIPLLGYKGVHGSGAWTIEKNRPVGSGNVDVAIGKFTKGGAGDIVAPFELKGPKTKDLDAIMAGRNKTPVQQAWEYAMDAKGAQWVLVSNMLEIRLYAVGYGRQAYEVFFLKDLHKPLEYARFCLLLSAKALLEGSAADLLKKSELADKDITNRLYRDYKTLRADLIQGLQEHNPTLGAEDAIQFAQTILDRVLFIAFAEDTRLLPERSLADAFEAEDDYAKMTVWERFAALFNWVDKGFPKRKIPPYNGGLFKQNKAIDKLNVPDSLCEGFKKLGEYDFSSEISVNILGHIFEQSITDLEEIKARLNNADYDAKKGKRKKDGVFYTPDYITRYIVEQAVGGWLDGRRRELGFYDLPKLDPAKDYPTMHTGKGKKGKVTVTLTPKAKKHLAYWKDYKNALAGIKVLDPACGSGAFLVQTFDYLLEEGLRVNTEIQRLQGGIIDIFERLDTSILKNNLYGVDLNPESVEITKLSLWLKTASSQEKLTYLDDNIKCGNSIVADMAVQPSAFDWNQQFANIVQAGGFDVVVGNPPYVRQELFKSDKPYLQKHYTTYHGVADLFAYFYEKGINLLKPNGLLGYISSSTFFKTSSGQRLRELLSQKVTLHRLIDFGDRQVFEGATTYPTIVILQKAKPAKGHEIAFTTVTDDVVNFATLEEHAATMPQSNLGSSSWQLENVTVANVRKKAIGKHPNLSKVYGSPLYGIKTGCNDAFIIDQATREKLVKADPAAAGLIKPFLEGQDFKPWHTEPRGLYIIFTHRGVSIDKYPSIKAHLLQYRDSLEPKPEGWDDVDANKGKEWLGRKAGTYKWYEIQDTVAYSKSFEGPKIVYGHFSVTPLFSMDAQGFYSNDKSYIIPNADWFLLALLNSSTMWFLIRGMSPPVRGGFYECRIQYMETLPIPKATKEQKAALGALAQQCQQAAEARYMAQQEVLKRIPDLAPNPATAKLTGKLQAWWELDFAAFSKEVEKTFRQAIPLKQRNEWEAYLADHRKQVGNLAHRISQLEQEINQQVYTLFGLTADDVAVVEA
ncbi:MAG: type I restriction endonuclease subunit M [Blastochloris viridis]|uniref:site-specific DNA-methyltransferase (adenine-specific) n=1 Tax=Blastochloris viridis TaxID=1079 RepID=A0A6N4R192_BLAVI|nr:MAG: type I restriction endonuclease subunit M [Blastochloris viridis]